MVSLKKFTMFDMVNLVNLVNLLLEYQHVKLTSEKRRFGRFDECQKRLIYVYTETYIRELNI